MVRTLRLMARAVLEMLSKPRLLLLVWSLNLLVALPAAIVIGEALQAALGHSLAADSMLQGFDVDWYGEFEYGAEGIGESFRPDIIGVGANLDNLEAMLSGEIFLHHPSLIASGLVFALLWTFLLAGTLSQFVHPEGVLRPASVITGAAEYFPRFLRLLLLAAPAYALLFFLARKLFPWIERALRDETRETLVLGWNLLAMGLVVLGLAFIHLVFDFAKISLVVEERRSALLATLRGLRFVVANPMRVALLMAFFSLLSLLTIFVYGLLAPGPSGGTPALLVAAFLAGQLVVVARFAWRLARLRAETDLYLLVSPGKGGAPGGSR